MKRTYQRAEIRPAPIRITTRSCPARIDQDKNFLIFDFVKTITNHRKMKDKQKVIRTRIKTNKRMNSKYEKKL